MGSRAAPEDDAERPTAVGRVATFGGPSASGLVASSADATERLSRTRRRDTAPERALRRSLHRRGLRFRIEKPVLPSVRRRVDVVFGPARVAVFVDGCFWHGCPEHVTWPKSNPDFWRAKIETNRMRDRDTDERLQAIGWRVVRIWEHEDPEDAADRIERLVRSRRNL